MNEELDGGWRNLGERAYDQNSNTCTATNRQQHKNRKCHNNKYPNVQIDRNDRAWIGEEVKVKEWRRDGQGSVGGVTWSGEGFDGKEETILK